MANKYPAFDKGINYKKAYNADFYAQKYDDLRKQYDALKDWAPNPAYEYKIPVKKHKVQVKKKGPSNEEILQKALIIFLQEGTTMEQARRVAKHALEQTGVAFLEREEEYDTDDWCDDCRCYIDEGCDCEDY